MMWAEAEDGRRIMATPGAQAKCPQCKHTVIAKCGELKIWHWAHEKRKECDSWFEPETLWHLQWKAQFPDDVCEVVVQKDGRIHRADILVNNTVVELQNSSISTKMIAARESFYNNMLWIFNAEGFEERLDFREKDGRYGEYWTFKWSHARKTITRVKAPLYFDFGPRYKEEFVVYWEDEPCREGSFVESIRDINANVYEREVERSPWRRIFQVRRIYPNGNGWGYFVHISDFLNQLKSDTYSMGHLTNPDTAHPGEEQRPRYW